MFENKTTGIHNLKLAHYISQYEVNEIVKEEQISVCDKLDKLYVIINEMKQQLRLLDDLIKARFVELFGNPVLNEKGWESNLLAQLTLKIGSGATPKGGREAYQEEGIALIRSMNVYNGKFE